MVKRVSANIITDINEVFSKTILTQLFTNDSSLKELQIYVYKKKGLLLTSFTVKINDSIKVKSKVIEKKKAEEKYTDSISSGNVAIIVSDEKNRLIINIGNIPPNAKVEFDSEFISFIDFNKKFEFELFRNFPVFCEDSYYIYECIDLKGKILIRSKNKIRDVNNEILFSDLEIEESKALNDNDYLIKYIINSLPYLNDCNCEYSNFIPCSRIFFDIKSLNNNNINPVIYKQKSNLNENNYILQYKNIEKKNAEEDDEETFPSLFIFLIDQSGSMSGSPIEIVSQALKLFLKSLPVGSYYQLIGFGSKFKKYDEIPKEYTKENIQKSIEFVENLDADLGGTNIYDPLNNIYSSIKDYNDIDLPKNVLLLTDGEINDKGKTLNLIENNNSKFIIHSIGIGKYFDKDLIKSVGIIGKGGYNFCKDLENLNSVIISIVNKITQPYLNIFEIKCHQLEDKSTFKNLNYSKFLGKNEIVKLNYILPYDKTTDINEKINVDIKYSDELDGSNLQEKKYEIIPNELPEGKELSKLIINNYLDQNTLSEEEKTKLSLKYQVLTDETALFAEIELSDKITEKMESQIIGSDKKFTNSQNNIISYGFSEAKEEERRYKSCKYECFEYSRPRKKKTRKGCGGGGGGGRYFDYKYESPEEKEKKEKKERKEKIMKIINTQDEIEGSWVENRETEVVKEKYLKEYNLLIGLKDKNVTEKIALTTIIILLVEKEYNELLGELNLIIKKAKKFIKEETKMTYQNLLKECGIN